MEREREQGRENEPHNNQEQSLSLSDMPNYDVVNGF